MAGFATAIFFAHEAWTGLRQAMCASGCVGWAFRAETSTQTNADRQDATTQTVTDASVQTDATTTADASTQFSQPAPPEIAAVSPCHARLLEASSETMD